MLRPETEGQRFAPDVEACADVNANDGVFLLTTDTCAAPEHYHACASKCDKRHATCVAGAANSGARTGCDMSFDTCANRYLHSHC